MSEGRHERRLPSKDDDILDDGVVAEINITPLTDIFLVLLIIFMVTSSAIVEAGGQSGVTVDLPGGGAGTEEISGQNDIVVAILEDGTLIFDGEATSLEDLGMKIEAAAKANKTTALIIQADRSVHHGRVVEIMELARARGLVNLAIATLSSEE